MADTKKCPKCNNEMVLGKFGQVQVNFYKGDNQRSLWTGLLSNKDRYQIIPYRCESCGFIEIYSKK